MKKLFLCVVCLLTSPLATRGESPPNGSFEDGVHAPSDWKLSGGTGAWAKEALEGKRCVSVTGTGKNSNYWSTPAKDLEPGQLYRFAFAYRTTTNARRGCVIAGPHFANRDFSASTTWKRAWVVFAAPKAGSGAYFRVGQWHRADTVLFDGVRLSDVAAVFAHSGTMALGEGETTANRTYRFVAPLRSQFTNYSRPLVEHTAGFNSNRWVFGAGQYVLYRHEIPGAAHTQARIKVNVGYYTSGELVIEAGRAPDKLTKIGRISAKGEKEFRLPHTMLPAEAVYVRLRASGGKRRGKDSAPGSFQVYSYEFTSSLSGSVPKLRGRTQFVDVTRRVGWLDVEIESIGKVLPGKANKLRVLLRNRRDRAVAAKVVVKLTGAGGAREFSALAQIPARGAVRREVAYDIPDAGKFDLRLEVHVSNQKIWAARTSVAIPRLYSTGYGYYGGRGPGCEWWWCESTYKVSRERPVPRADTTQPVQIAAARGEYEAAQIVLRPMRTLRGVRVSVDTPNPTWAKNISILLVHYLYVSHPTDSSSCVGWWPDALPPYEGPIGLDADQNQPIWLRVHVPRNAKPGTYALRLNVEAKDGLRLRVPVRVKVYDFAIPKTHHVESGFGISLPRICRYHNLKKPADVRKVWGLYMQDFREHRMAPYDFAPRDPIRVSFEGLHWQGGEIVSRSAASGEKCLKIEDRSETMSASCSQMERMTIGPGRAYVLSWAARTQKEGQKYLVTLQTYNKDGRWIPYHNIDLLRVGSRSWRRERFRVVVTKRSPQATAVSVALRPVPYSSRGAGTGTAWFDDLSFVREGTKENLIADGGFESGVQQAHVRVDFSAWDRQAKRYLDEFGFSGFRLRLVGMGGGTFHSRREGRIGPYRQGSPEYRRLFREYTQQLAVHLDRMGWLGKEYIYWFDEPRPEDYDFVRRGMEEIHLASPRLRRMLTEEPEEPLFGAVDVWCPVLHRFDPKMCAARQHAGEKIWWYVCTGPKAPYPGLFIDHDAIELRIWLWMTWKWNVQGILVWQTTYWTSPCAFPRPKMQNPWVDPMGYQAGYGRPRGYIGYWGNGDGRFLYPPNRDIEHDKRPYVTGPVDSIRWEMLRDGLEDYEYFWVLRDELRKAKARGASTVDLREAEHILTIPETIIQTTKSFTRDPRLLFVRRARVAEAIEKLRR